MRKLKQLLLTLGLQTSVAITKERTNYARALLEINPASSVESACALIFMLERGEDLLHL